MSAADGVYGVIRPAGSFTGGIATYAPISSGGYTTVNGEFRSGNKNQFLEDQLKAQQVEALKKQNAMTWQQVNPTLVETDEQKAAKQYLLGQMNTDQTYQGDRFAKNEYNDQIRGQLASYLGSTAGTSLLDAAGKQYTDTLAGNYDPTSGQYYQGLRQQADLNLSDALNRYSQGQYLKGNLRSTTTDAGRGRLIAENEANLNTVLGQLAWQERQNLLSAASGAAGLAGQYDTLAQNRLSATQNTGEYLRQQEQQQKDFAYEQWKANLERKQGLANTLYTTPQTYMYPQYQLR